jgi:hypothetical protein
MIRIRIKSAVRISALALFVQFAPAELATPSLGSTEDVAIFYDL